MLMSLSDRDSQVIFFSNAQWQIKLHNFAFFFFSLTVYQIFYLHSKGIDKYLTDELAV